MREAQFHVLTIQSITREGYGELHSPSTCTVTIPLPLLREPHITTFSTSSQRTEAGFGGISWAFPLVEGGETLPSSCSPLLATFDIATWLEKGQGRCHCELRPLRCSQLREHVTQTEILMLERVHRKILRTILNLPIRCPSKSLLNITGMLSISDMIHHRQLNFIHSFSLLPADSLPCQLFHALSSRISPNSTTSRLQSLLHHHSLPPISTIPTLQLSKRSWKQGIKRLLWVAQLSNFLASCSHLPLAQCSILHRCKPIPQLLICRGFPKTTKRNNIRIRLLVNCDGLQSDTCRFRASSTDDTCRLCRTAREDALHLISHCPALSSARDISRLSALDPLKFTEYILGIEWIDDPPLQRIYLPASHRAPAQTP